MMIQKASVFQLIVPFKYRSKLSQFAGSNRYIYNKALDLIQTTYQATNSYLNYYDLAEWLTQFKKEHPFLKEVHSQTLQQTLKHLSTAFQSFFAHTSRFPRFKKRGISDSFRYPQGFKVDGNGRIFSSC